MTAGTQISKRCREGTKKKPFCVLFMSQTVDPVGNGEPHSVRDEVFGSRVPSTFA